MEEIINQLKQDMVKILSDQLRTCLTESSKEIANRRGAQSATYNVYREIDNIVARFSKFLEYDFDKLVRSPLKKRVEIGGYKLNLVTSDYYHSVNALEGMVAYTRNAFLSEYIAFTTRMNSLFFNYQLNESNNPLDPEQIAEALVDSLRLLPLIAIDTLLIYRKFNQTAFHKMGTTLARANEILIERGIKPDLVIHAKDKVDYLQKRNRNRPDTNPAERAFFNQDEKEKDSRQFGARELFVILKKLTHGKTPNELNLKHLDIDQAVKLQDIELAIPVAAMANQQLGEGALSKTGLMLVDVKPDRRLGRYSVQVLTKPVLLDLFTSVQNDLAGQLEDFRGDRPSSLEVVNEISKAIKDSAEPDSICAIDAASYDVINILALVYEAIEKDFSLIDPIKNLVCRTHLAVTRLALRDPEFFQQQQHPVSVLLDKIANAGIGWLEPDKLNQDETFIMMQKIVNRLITATDADNYLVGTLLEEFDQFKTGIEERLSSDAMLGAGSEQQHQRMDKIRAYVTGKIKERIQEALHPLIEEILFTHFHRFVVELVLHEGIGSNSWKHVVSTIDELLWSVKSVKSAQDRERFEKMNPRLISNLAKAFRIAGIKQDEQDDILRRLETLQDDIFRAALEEKDKSVSQEIAKGVFLVDTDIPIDFGDDDESNEKTIPPQMNDYLLQVNKLPLGVWLEFRGADSRKIVCSLAAKLDTIDKFIFVNRQGVKIMEKTRTTLANEMRAGIVKIISESPVFERAMEAVVALLREHRVG